MQYDEGILKNEIKKPKLMRSASVGGKLKMNWSPVFFLAAKVENFLNLPNRFSWAVV